MPIGLRNNRRIEWKDNVVFTMLSFLLLFNKSCDRTIDNAVKYTYNSPLVRLYEKGNIYETTINRRTGAAIM